MWQKVREAYSGTTAQYTNLTLSMFCDPAKPHADFPQLKGKGAEVKDLVRPLLTTREQCRVDISYEYQTIKDLLTTQVQVQDILSDYSQEMFLPVPVANNLVVLVDNFLHLYTLLANRADRDKELLWSVTPKFHWLFFLNKVCFFFVFFWR